MFSMAIINTEPKDFFFFMSAETITNLQQRHKVNSPLNTFQCHLPVSQMRLPIENI